jgi:hypothetical protein
MSQTFLEVRNLVKIFRQAHRVGFFESHNHPHGGGLAATAGSKQGDHFSLFHFERRVIERRQPDESGTMALADICNGRADSFLRDRSA